MKNYGQRFMTLFKRQGLRLSARKRYAKRQNGCLRRSYKQLRKEKLKAKEKRKDLKAEFQKIARRDKKAFLSDHCKEIEKNNRMGKTRDLFKTIKIPREHFMQR